MNKKNSDLEMKTKLEVFYSQLKIVKTRMMFQMFQLIKINNKIGERWNGKQTSTFRIYIRQKKPNFNELIQ